MKQQMILIDTPPEWRIDNDTCELGRRGLAEARRVLEEVNRRLSDDESRTAA